MGTPNVVLITVDCLRADRLGVLGNEDGLTPALDRLAVEGVCCTNAYANGPKTVTSFPSILSSSYPFQYADHLKLSDERTTVAKVLQTADYYTAAFNSNPLLVTSMNYANGFAHFEKFSKEAAGPRERGERKLRRALGAGSTVRRTLRRTFRTLFGYSYVPYARAHEVNRTVLKFMQTVPQPFFVWIHYMDPHQPYAPVREYMPIPAETHRRLMIKLSSFPQSITTAEQALIEKTYDAEVRYQDRHVAWLLEGLEALGLAKNLLVIVTADHGEEFREHGDFFHATAKAVYKAKLHEELLHVPLILWSPTGLVASGRKVSELVHLADLGPTIVDFLGVDKPGSWVGTSLLPLIREQSPDNRRSIFAQQAVKHPDPSRPWGLAVSARSPSWAFIYNSITEQHELYDRVRDPGEAENLNSSQPEVAHRLESEVARHIKDYVHPDYRTGIPDLDDFGIDTKVLDRLRQLGYVA